MRTGKPNRYPSSSRGREYYDDPEESPREYQNHGSEYDDPESGAERYQRYGSESRRQSYPPSSGYYNRPDEPRRSPMGSEEYRGGEYGRGRGEERYGREAGQRSEGEFYRYGLDSQRRGRHFGKGPKGYQRSDERIKEDVSEALTQHPDLDASEIEVRVTAGEVILTGTVDSREAKRAAEEAAEDAPGVKEVQNQLRITRGQEFGGQSATMGEVRKQTGSPAGSRT